MQITTPRGDFIEKILRDTNGRLVKATFCVYEEAGRVKARLLNFVYIDDDNVLSLASYKQEIYSFIENEDREKILSPYFDFDILTFFGSKPRAPAFKSI